MLSKLTDGTKAFLFYAIALLLALAVALVPGTTTFANMFTPLVALISAIRFKPPRRMPPTTNSESREENER